MHFPNFGQPSYSTRLAQLAAKQIRRSLYRDTGWRNPALGALSCLPAAISRIPALWCRTKYHASHATAHKLTTRRATPTHRHPIPFRSPPRPRLTFSANCTQSSSPPSLSPNSRQLASNRSIQSDSSSPTAPRYPRTIPFRNTPPGSRLNSPASNASTCWTDTLVAAQISATATPRASRSCLNASPNRIIVPFPNCFGLTLIFSCTKGRS